MKVKVIVGLMVFLLTLLPLSAGCPPLPAPDPPDPAPLPVPAPVPRIAFPTRPIEVIIPFGAGGGVDLTARAIISGAQKHLGQPLVPVNRPGAGGMVGAEVVLGSKPDGYTILFAALSTIAIQPHFGVARYTHNTFQPVIRLAESTHVFKVRADAPWKTFAEFVAYAERNPGKFTYSTPGPGTTSHLAGESIAAEFGLRLKHVPFATAGEALVAMLGGHVDAAVMLTVGPIDPTRIRVLAVMGDVMPAALRDVPTVRELGSRYSFPVTIGVVVPPGTPLEVVAILYDAFKKGIEDPDSIQMMEKVGSVPRYGDGATQQEEFTFFFHHYGRVMREAGLVR
jgi:tripartite-type tricarboxylate transporter receptor subunit TctC